ncbi:MAG: HPr family phosphocarrier protein [Oscillospiraceae bacterium]|nr:HPr family phosphocarrier protein [Oscillospiraceae bacterium]
MFSKIVTVVNRNIYTLPTLRMGIIRKSRKFLSQVRIEVLDVENDKKYSLSYAKAGTKIRITAKGIDERAAVEAIAAFVEEGEYSLI